MQKKKKQKKKTGKSLHLLQCFVSPALEGGPSDGILGGMSIPRGMTRRAMSYDESLEGPMSPLPTDINISNLWKRPVIPDRKFQRLAEVCPNHLIYLLKDTIIISVISFIKKINVPAFDHVGFNA